MEEMDMGRRKRHDEGDARLWVLAQLQRIRDERVPDRILDLARELEHQLRLTGATEPPRG